MGGVFQSGVGTQHHALQSRVPVDGQPRVAVPPAGGVGGQGQDDIPRLEVHQGRAGSFDHPVFPGKPAQKPPALGLGRVKKQLLGVQNGLEVPGLQQLLRGGGSKAGLEEDGLQVALLRQSDLGVIRHIIPVPVGPEGLGRQKRGAKQQHGQDRQQQPPEPALFPQAAQRGRNQHGTSSPFHIFITVTQSMGRSKRGWKNGSGSFGGGM